MIVVNVQMNHVHKKIFERLMPVEFSSGISVKCARDYIFFSTFFDKERDVIRTGEKMNLQSDNLL